PEPSGPAERGSQCGRCRPRAQRPLQGGPRPCRADRVPLPFSPLGRQLCAGWGARGGVAEPRSGHPAMPPRKPKVTRAPPEGPHQHADDDEAAAQWGPGGLVGDVEKTCPEVGMDLQDTCPELADQNQAATSPDRTCSDCGSSLLEGGAGGDAASSVMLEDDRRRRPP
ncbi:unnamed protein product, partial [Prorocentrum cordatum]